MYKDSILQLIAEKAPEATSEVHLAQICNLSRPTVSKYAKALGIDVKNVGGKGKPHGTRRYELKDILEGHYPHYPTSKLKSRLVAEGYKKEVCEECGCGAVWNNKPLTLQVDHKDGDNTNHRLENLRLLCPNCHTQTSTFGSKNVKK